MTGSKLKIPPKLIVLDLVGALLVAVGVLNMMGEGGIEGVVYFVVGLLLMVPLITHILKSILWQKSGSINCSALNNAINHTIYDHHTQLREYNNGI